VILLFVLHFYSFIALIEIIYASVHVQIHCNEQLFEIQGKHLYKLPSLLLYNSEYMGIEPLTRKLAV